MIYTTQKIEKHGLSKSKIDESIISTIGSIYVPPYKIPKAHTAICT